MSKQTRPVTVNTERTIGIGYGASVLIRTEDGKVTSVLVMKDRDVLGFAGGNGNATNMVGLLRTAADVIEEETT